jgi:hypothetical protein
MNAIILRLLPYIAALLIGAVGAWMWQANSYGQQLAVQALLHQSDLEAISNAATAKIRSDQEMRLALEQRLSASEQTHYKELSDAQVNQKRLRDRLATADLRLSVLIDAADPASGSAVPTGTATGGLVHGGTRARLDPAHAQRIVAITDAGDQGLIALRACQAYVRDISR